jgi:hypothetical protein
MVAGLVMHRRPCPEAPIAIQLDISGMPLYYDLVKDCALPLISIFNLLRKYHV